MMIHLKNIRSQNAATPEQFDLTRHLGVIWLISEDGKNWYDELANFAPDTLKIAYDSEGVIRRVDTDASMINPEGFSVVELPATTANRRADISGRWGFDGTGVIDLLTPEVARQQKTAEINNWRAIQEDANYVFTFNGRRWDYGKATQDRLTLSVQMARQNKLPAGFIWTDADNNDVPMTADELLTLSDAIDQAMFTRGLQIHMKQRAMKEELSALTDVKAILAYEVNRN
ncbi:phage tail protein [Salmonella enterica subsp. enterica serovar Minnesota]|nr:phage tail protein [Salmonella enterica subsp. enterica serovar Minnesota]